MTCRRVVVCGRAAPPYSRGGYYGRIFAPGVGLNGRIFAPGVGLNGRIFAPGVGLKAM